MNEEIEYAEMLEIPVSTVNVVRKNSRRKKRAEGALPKSAEPQETPLKDSVIAQVNERLREEPAAQEDSSSTPLQVEPDLFAESVNSEGRLDFDPIPERIDTVRLYSTEESTSPFADRLHAQDYSLNSENEGGRYALKKKTRLEKALDITLNAEFIAACALCGAIFLTNVFMPQSAINTFFRAIADAPAIVQTDDRTYADFNLSPVVSVLSDAELTLSPAGILSFQDDCCVYPCANGKVAEVSHSTDGIYTIKIKYSDSFSGVINGLSQVYYAVGDEVKANVPVGYADGKTEVQVTMYDSGALLNCFHLTEENCLAWLENSEEK